MPGPVVIRIPADTAHVTVIRSAAGALAARHDFSFDRITDLHIAIDEACSRLLAVVDSPQRIEFSLEVTDGPFLRLRASIDGTRRADRELFTEWSRVILEAVANDIVVLPDGDAGAALELLLARDPT